MGPTPLVEAQSGPHSNPSGVIPQEELLGLGVESASERVFRLTCQIARIEVPGLLPLLLKSIINSEISAKLHSRPRVCCGMGRDKANRGRRIKCPLSTFHRKEKDMRIICDHCSKPISGTIKRIPGSLNLHPECLAQLGEETKPELTAISWRSGESAVSMLLERKGTEKGLSPA